MKIRFRMMIIVFVILAMSLMVFPVSARGTSTHVTGDALVLNISGGKIWTTGQYVQHYRDRLMEFQYVTSDPRMDGFSPVLNNADYHFTPEMVLLFAHVQAVWTIYDEPEYITPKWVCSDQGTIYSDYSFLGQGVCRGVGENEGLLLKFTLTFTDFNYWDMQFDGVITDPGGE